MNMKNGLPVNQQIHRECNCHKCSENAESGNMQDSTENLSLIRKLKYYGVLRFAGWWSIFAGAIAVNSVCPVCGSQGCPVGVGTTGIIAAFFAGTRQWGGIIIKKFYLNVRNIFRKNSNKDEIKRGINMSEIFNASDITKGFHPDGYRIDKTASPLDFYTKWEITLDGKWINPKPSCFHSMPQEGWHKTDSFE